MEEGIFRWLKRWIASTTNSLIAEEIRRNFDSMLRTFARTVVFSMLAGTSIILVFLSVLFAMTEYLLIDMPVALLVTGALAAAAALVTRPKSGV